MYRRIFLALVLAAVWIPANAQLELGDKGYFETHGLNVIVFDDIYPEGHQTGVTIIQHGVRVAANGDLRLEASPGQWSPVPVAGDRIVNEKTRTITQTLSYPDPDRDRKGFNPIVYPDLELTYRVSVQALEGSAFRITVDLDNPLPDEWVGKVGFNFELFPGDLFGKAWLMDDHAGHFPTQPNGPIGNVHGEHLATPLATGRKLVVAPDNDNQRLVIESRSGLLELLDGRTNHNNSWFIVRTEVPADATEAAVEWVIRPNVVEDWQSDAVIQVSQLGYTTTQPKRVVIEQDKRDEERSLLTIYRLTENGREKVRSVKPERWDGEFLRFNYLLHDFSDIDEPGMYVIEYRSKTSHPFRIDADVFGRHAWQPTLEYYLPVQMCHMRINEKYRVWHGNDHADDALMAPVNHNHFDGYIQGPSTLTTFAPMEPVPGLNSGGWHDAGDYDLRVESQMGTVWVLAQMIEEFGLDYDATSIDQDRKLVEIHVPDNKSDALQQIEHGLLSVLGGYRALGRLYRGIIVPDLRQYVLLGDASVQTDNLVHDPDLQPGEVRGGRSGNPDDRWVFTEENPDRELTVAAGLAAASRVLDGYNNGLAEEALQAAQDIFDGAIDKTDSIESRVFALSELIQSTRDSRLIERLLAIQDEIVADVGESGWALAKAMPYIDDVGFRTAIAAAVRDYQKDLEAQSHETPYGVPYRPHIWGAGWGIQEFGVKQYLFTKGWPEYSSPDYYVNALNFILGVHPGSNTMSFASGVGSESALVAYGVNRADWSFIPGGVISGTALIRPDYPELKIWPFFWQQTEYVIGGGGTNFMFLVLAVDRLYGNSAASPDQARSIANRVADWQLAHMDSFDYVRTFRDHTEQTTGWVQAAFYIGLTRWAAATGNADYVGALLETAERNGWQLGPRYWHADDQAIAQVYLPLAGNDDARVETVVDAFDRILIAPPDNSLEFRRDDTGQSEGTCQERWCWSDALFMAPPAWLMTSNVTGDPKYRDYALREYQATKDYLYDEDRHLFYRDSRFFDRRTEFGNPVFWSRGNGWVFAGLPLLLEALPAEHPQRQSFLTLFREMAAAFKDIQHPDGYWSSSLLDVAHDPVPETSGTAFITFGLAWGVNRGIIAEEDFRAVVEKGWRAVAGAVDDQGKLGWVQQVGNAPDDVKSTDTQLYGSGALLLAASEMLDWQR